MTTPRSRAIYAAQGAYSLFIHRAYVAEGFEAPANLDGYRFTDSRSGYVVILRRNGACDATATRLANLPGAEPVEAVRERESIRKARRAMVDKRLHDLDTQGGKLPAFPVAEIDLSDILEPVEVTGDEIEAEPVEAASRRAPALPVSIMPRAKPRALWSFPASRVADAIDGATEWLCSAESFGFDGSEALAFN